MGRPKRDLPEGIGEEKDLIVAMREGCSEEAIRTLRHRSQIPPPSDKHRAAWEDRHGLAADDVMDRVRLGEWGGD